MSVQPRVNAPTPSVRRTRLARRVLPHLEGYLYVLPALAVLGLFHLWPSLYTFYLSLHNWNLIQRVPRFIGLANYERLWSDEYFWLALRNTATYALGVVPASLVIGLLLALLLVDAGRMSGLYRVLLFTPVVTAASAAAVIWKWMYAPDEQGLFNALLGLVGVAPRRWLQDPDLAMFSVTLLGIWKSIGYNVVIFYAGLRNIAVEYREAARIDGATAWQEFRHIVLPLLSPTTYFVLIVSVISSFQVFSQVYVMTRGGPLGRTMVLVYYIYDRAFGSFRIGYAAAIAFALFGIILCLTLLQRAVLQNRIHYDN